MARAVKRVKNEWLQENAKLVEVGWLSGGSGRSA